jgi:hypothetical protein
MKTGSSGLSRPIPLPSIRLATPWGTQFSKQLSTTENRLTIEKIEEYQLFKSKANE